MKKLLVLFLILLIMLNTVSAQPFSERVPDIPFFTGTCKPEGMKDTKHAYDCFVNFFLYWLGYSTDERHRYEYEGSTVDNPRTPWDESKILPAGPAGLFREVILPLVALGVITYGFLININIFGRRNRWINVVMTFIILLFSFPTGIFHYFIWISLWAASKWAFILWVGLFFIGTWSIFRRARAAIGTEAAVVEVGWHRIQELERERKELLDTKADLLTDLAVASPENKEKISAEINKIDKRISNIDADIKTLKRKIS